MSEEDALKRLQQSQEQTRASEPTPDDQHQPLDEAVADAFAALDDGSIHPNITFRDERLSAVFHALDETDRLDDVVKAAAKELGRYADANAEKSDAYRLLLRVGLQQVAEDVTEAGVAGYREFQQRQIEQTDEL